MIEWVVQHDNNNVFMYRRERRIYFYYMNSIYKQKCSEWDGSMVSWSECECRKDWRYMWSYVCVSVSKYCKQ